MGPSYQCHPHTVTQLPCGGWVSVNAGTSGKTEVALGVLGHYAFYQYVSGVNGADAQYFFPPAASVTQFWAQNTVVELDASGHGHANIVFKSAQGVVTQSASYDVSAANGAITVSMQSDLDPGSCNDYQETCTFTAKP
jgi:hypothetical protein